MGILAKINWIDILSIIIIVRMSYVALQDGLSREIFPLIGIILTACISSRYYPDITAFIRSTVNISVPILDLLGFLVLVAGFGLIFRLMRCLVDAILKVTWHPIVEKFGGLIFGFARAAIMVSIILSAMMLAPFSYLHYSVKDKSFSGPYFLKIIPEISGKISWAFPSVVKK